jgi:hypothetical protein
MFSLTIDFEFEKTFQSIKPSIDDTENDDFMHQWIDIRNFILFRSSVEVLHENKITATDLSINYPFIFKLYNDYIQNIKDVAIIKPIDSNANRYKNKMLHYFFIDNIKLLDFNPLKLGLIRFNSNSIVSNWKWEGNYTFSHRNEITDFSFKAIKKFKHPTKEIIIIDRYILSNVSKFKFNITNLLKSIITPTDSIKLFILTSSTDLDIIYKGDLNTIKNMISQILKPLFASISIEIFLDYRGKRIQDRKTGNTFDIFHREHSRYIFTNYFMLNARQGFHFYNALNEKNLNYSDEITFSPLHHKDNNRIARNVLQSLTSILTSNVNQKNNNIEIFKNTNEKWLEFLKD